MGAKRLGRKGKGRKERWRGKVEAASERKGREFEKDTSLSSEKKQTKMYPVRKEEDDGSSLRPRRTTGPVDGEVAHLYGTWGRRSARR